jgi:hypothetical protein
MAMFSTNASTLGSTIPFSYLNISKNRRVGFAPSTGERYPHNASCSIDILYRLIRQEALVA